MNSSTEEILKLASSRGVLLEPDALKGLSVRMDGFAMLQYSVAVLCLMH